MKFIDSLKQKANRLFESPPALKDRAVLSIDLEDFTNRKDLLLALFQEDEIDLDNVSEAVNSKYIKDGEQHYPIEFHNLKFGNYVLVLYTNPDYLGYYQNTDVAYPITNELKIKNFKQDATQLDDFVIDVRNNHCRRKLKFIPFPENLKHHFSE